MFNIHTNRHRRTFYIIYYIISSDRIQNNRQQSLNHLLKLRTITHSSTFPNYQQEESARKTEDRNEKSYYSERIEKMRRTKNGSRRSKCDQWNIVYIHAMALQKVLGMWKYVLKCSSPTATEEKEEKEEKTKHEEKPSSASKTREHNVNSIDREFFIVVSHVCVCARSMLICAHNFYSRWCALLTFAIFSLPRALSIRVQYWP